MIYWYGLSVSGLPAHSLEGSFSKIKATTPKAATEKNITTVDQKADRFNASDSKSEVSKKLILLEHMSSLNKVETQAIAPTIDGPSAKRVPSETEHLI